MNLLLAILGILALFAAGVWWWIFRLPLPRISGTLRAGVAAPVEIVRDTWGIPHIFAESLTDAAFAHGIVHAQDRLWQMELNRRVSAGRLSEKFGKVALDADRFLRRLGLRRAAELEELSLCATWDAESLCRYPNPDPSREAT